MIDSQMDDMIKEKVALKQQIDSLKQNLSNQIKEKKYLLQIVIVFKNESKEKESKYMDKEIDLEKEIKELDVLLLVMNFTTLNVESMNMGMQRSESCDKCFDLDTELLEPQNAYHDLSIRIFKLDIEPVSHRLMNNMDAYEDYLNKTVENTDTIHELVERAKKYNLSEPLLDSACKFTKHVQELLVYVSQTNPSFIKPSKKLVGVTPMNKVKKVRIEEFYHCLQITAYRQ
nr:hypothetical protein [Tanacetum cinerariifolium]